VPKAKSRRAEYRRLEAAWLLGLSAIGRLRCSPDLDEVFWTDATHRIEFTSAPPVVGSRGLGVRVTSTSPTSASETGAIALSESPRSRQSRHDGSLRPRR